MLAVVEVCGLGAQIFGHDLIEFSAEGVLAELAT